MVLILLLVLGYILGPRAKFEKVNNTPMSIKIPLSDIDNYVKNNEAKITNIKADNQAQILWADSLHKTAYAFVYLHGFTASHGEGYPIIQNLAQKYHSNTFLSRIHSHGLNDKDAFLNLTPKSMIESAKEAIAIGKTIGHKVIVMSCSTGSTYSTFLAAADTAIVAQVMLAPNFDLHDPNSKLMVKPWGKNLMQYMMGGNYRDWGGNDEIRKYWNTVDRIEGYIALRALLDQTMTKDIFKKNDTPTFIGYYYKDEAHKDEVISISAIKNYTKEISTPASDIKVIPFSTASGHVICSSYMNPQWASVQDSIYRFLDAQITFEDNEKAGTQMTLKSSNN